MSETSPLPDDQEQPAPLPEDSFAEDLAEKAESREIGTNPKTVLHNSYRGRK